MLDRDRHEIAYVMSLDVVMVWSTSSFVELGRSNPTHRETRRDDPLEFGDGTLGTMLE